MIARLRRLVPSRAPRRLRRGLRRPPALLVAAALAAAAATAARADGPPPVGPPLGNVRYVASIEDGTDGEDTDDYTGDLAAGERLSLRVTSPFRSGLYPFVEVIDPEGTIRNVAFRFRKLGRDIELRSYPLDRTGRWTVRIRAREGTRGEYAAKFAVRGPAPASVSVDPDPDGATPADVGLEFDAIEGSRVQIRARSRRGAAPSLVSLEDPSGAEVLDDQADPVVALATTRRGAVSLVVPSVAAGNGTYRARLTAPAGHKGFSAQARVVSPKRASGRRTLSDVEPWFEPRLSPLRGVHGREVRIYGDHFSTQGSVRVLFDGIEGATRSVESHGAWLDVDPPVLPDGSTVAVDVVNPDGQAYRRDDYFHYVAAPRMDAMVDADGLPVVGGSTEGGRVVRILGAAFQSGVFLRFGASADVLPRIRSSEEIEVTVPPQPEGTVAVRMFDAFLHDVLLEGGFEYKTPPRVGSPAYSPETALTDGTTVLTVLGSDFQPTDVVHFDGTPLATTYLGSQFLRVTIPAATAGQHPLSVVDRVGTVANGPPLTLVDP